MTRPIPLENFEPARDRTRYTAGDLFDAGLENQRLNENNNSDQEAIEKAYDYLIQRGSQAGLVLPDNPMRSGRSAMGSAGRYVWRPEGERGDLPTAMQTESAEVYRRMVEFERAWKDGLLRNENIRATMDEASREAVGRLAAQYRTYAADRYERIRAARGNGLFSIDTLVDFGSAAIGYFNDPLQAATTFTPTGTSKTILGAGVREALVNIATDAALQPGVQAGKLEAGVIDDWAQAVGDGLSNVGLSGALGFLFGAGGKGLERLLDRPGAQTAEAPGEVAATPAPDPDQSFAQAREALQALADFTADTDPENSALVRNTLQQAERDYATARQKPNWTPDDEFVAAVEAADARVRALEELAAPVERDLPDAPERFLDTSDEAPAPEMGARLEEDGKPVTFTRFDPRALEVAPGEMQYKRYAGGDGVNDAIADVETWHAPSSGKVLVFERENGEQVIVDGHQRRALARGIASRSGRNDIRLDGYLYREADGWTIPEMRLKGAQKNIREGRSDVLDTAQALRENPNAIDKSFPVSRSNIRQARQLARLSPEAWDVTRAGVLDPQYAALIGAVAPDRPEIHGPLARTLIEADPANIREAENIVSEALMDYAERHVAEQPSLFGEDSLGRAALYKERAQIMDAAYEWLRSERSVFKALVEKGDIARAIGNELVDQANLDAKDQVDLAIAAVMHSRRAGVRSAVTDMVARAVDSVRREGVTPRRAGQQVARDIRALVEEQGFRALLDPQGPRPAAPADSAPLFDMPGSPEHAAQADILEGSLRPEGPEPEKLDLEQAAAPPDPMEALVAELSGRGQGEARPVRDVLKDIEAIASPKAAKGKEPDPLAQAIAEIEKLEKSEEALRAALQGLTEGHQLRLLKMQFPDSYPTLNRLTGPDLEDAIVARVMAGQLKFARRGGPNTEIGYKKFQSDLLSPNDSKIVEMAMNGISNLDIAVEMDKSVNAVKVALSKALKKLREAGVEVTVEPGQTGRTIDGQGPGAVKAAVWAMAEEGLQAGQIIERLKARGMETAPTTVYITLSRWRAAKRKGLKLANGDVAGTFGSTREELIAAAKAEFGDAAGALFRMGEVNIIDTRPVWAPRDTMAWTDNKGRVTLVAGNIRPSEMRGLILHEIGVHSDLVTILGEDGKAAVLQQIEARLAAGDASVVAARNRVPDTTRPDHVTEETLAYLVQHAPSHTLVQQLLADIRAWLYRTFPMLRDAMTLTDADVQSLAMGAVRSRVKEVQFLEYQQARSGAVHASGSLRYALAVPRTAVDVPDELVMRASEALTPAQFEAWKGATEGLTTDAIAERLGPAVTSQQVRAHLQNARQKGFDVPKGINGGMAETTRRLIELKAKGLSNEVIARRVFPDDDLAAARSRVKRMVYIHSDKVQAERERLASTSGVKYARRGNDQDPDIAGSRGPAPADAGAAGQPDAAAGGTGGARAQPGGQAEPGARPSRAVATEPLPEPPEVSGRWNERIELSPEQRAQRREQFRDFVEQAVVEVDISTARTDWLFRNGKRYVGPNRIVEYREFAFQVDPSWHESWQDQLGRFYTRIMMEVHGEEATVSDASVADTLRSTGLGEKLYRSMIDQLLVDGKVVNSDVSLSENAMALWKSLRRKGYDVKQRVPDAVLERGPDGQYSHPDGDVAIFYVARKKPRQPDLPEMTRDLLNRIDEARDLNEHMPACMKGRST